MPKTRRKVDLWIGVSFEIIKFINNLKSNNHDLLLFDGVSLRMVSIFAHFELIRFI